MNQWRRFDRVSVLVPRRRPRGAGLAQAPHGRERAAGTVTATQLGAHLALSRQHICTLADVEHIIERLPNGRFDQDACRLAYLKWLRDPARRSARTQADAEFQRAKTELLKIKIAEKHKILMRICRAREVRRGAGRRLLDGSKRLCRPMRRP